MKQYVLRFRLKDLICIFIISALLTGCAGTMGSSPVAYEVFNPRYYILKKADKSDYDRLEKLRLSKNPQTAASAGLILGMYYLRYDKDIANAEPLLIDSYNSKNLTPYMERTGELWLMELEIAKARGAQARGWADKILSAKEQSVTDEVLQTYCVIMCVYPTAEEGNFACVETRLKMITEVEAATDKPPLTVGEIKPREGLTDTINILVISNAESQDVSGGVYFYARKHNTNHKIRMSKSYRDGEWDFIMDIDNANLTGAGYSVDFKPDINGLFLNMEKYAALKECGRVLIGYGAGLRETAQKLQSNLKNETAAGKSANIIVGTVDITDSGAARGIRGYLSGWERSAFCAVGAGTEEEINNFTPYVKQYVRYRDRQRIFLVQTLDTGKHYTGDYLSYYRNAYIFPLIDFNLDKEMAEFAVEYNNFSGQALSYEALMGYDMMQYIYTQTEERGNAAAPYLTNITGFDGEKVIRSARAFYIDNQGNVQPIVLE